MTLEIEQIKENKDSINDKKASLSETLSQARLQERDLLNEKRFESSDITRLKQAIVETESAIESLESLLNSKISEEERHQLPDLKNQVIQVANRKQLVEQRLVQLRFENEDYQARLEEIEEKLGKELEKNESYIRKQTKLEAAGTSH